MPKNEWEVEVSDDNPSWRESEDTFVVEGKDKLDFRLVNDTDKPVLVTVVYTRTV